MFEKQVGHLIDMGALYLCRDTEIQHAVEVLLHLHAGVCHHRGQFLQKLDFLPAPHQPARVLRRGVWLRDQQGEQTPACGLRAAFRGGMHAQQHQTTKESVT